MIYFERGACCREGNLPLPEEALFVEGVWCGFENAWYCSFTESGLHASSLCQAALATWLTEFISAFVSTWTMWKYRSASAKRDARSSCTSANEAQLLETSSSANPFPAPALARERTRTDCPVAWLEKIQDKQNALLLSNATRSEHDQPDMPGAAGPELERRSNAVFRTGLPSAK
jgi:hypothetical protein